MKKFILFSVFVIFFSSSSKSFVNSYFPIGGGVGTTPKPNPGNGGGIVLTSNY